MEALENYLNTGGTLSSLARSIGVSVSAVSQIKAGSYKGDANAILAKIDKYLSKEQTSAQKAKTKDYEMIHFCIKEAHLGKEIALVYGNPGTGKTYAIKAWANANPNAILIESSVGSTAKTTLNAIAKELKTQGNTINELIANIVSAAKMSDRVLIVDEAEHLPTRALEALRRINDFCGMPIVLCGTHIALRNMLGKNRELSQLYSRVSSKWETRGLSKDETDLIFGKGIYAHAKGNARASAKLSLKAKRLAQLQGANVSDEIISYAKEMIIV